MRSLKTLFVLVAFFSLGSGAHGANLFFDNFNRANSDSMGASWTERLGDWDILSNKMRGNSAANTNNVVHTSAFATADYTVEVIITPGDTDQHRGPCGRRVNYSTDDSNCYTALLTTGGADLDTYKRISGTWTKIADGTFSHSVGVAATIKLHMQGTTIKAFANGVEKSSVTDSALSAAGDAACLQGDSTVNDYDDFSVDDFGAAAAPPQRMLMGVGT